jgi:two-component system, chemotaxis family, protein-glutamate methylesterase/glutaminase
VAAGDHGSSTRGPFRGSSLTPAPQPQPGEQSYPTRDTVVVGASAGGVEALTCLVRGLPADFPATMLVVLHLMAGARSMLPQILARSGALAADLAFDGAPLHPSRIYVAPPDHHMLLRGDALRLSRGPRENGHRPAIDPLFRSAARARGPRVIGIILSGLLDDGAVGLSHVKDHGGVAIVQHPDDALHSAMPTAAMAASETDRLVPIEDMPDALIELAGQPAPVIADEDWETVKPEPGTQEIGERIPTPLSCPVCGGAMWETLEASLLRFTCPVGHAYSVESMLDEHGTAVESAMWRALRIVEERADLLARIARRQNGATRTRFQHRADAVRRQAVALRRVLIDEDPIDLPPR